jgi:hypothetical protein
MNPTTITYTIYLLLSIGLTIWVARTLHRNGGVFLVDCFHGNEPLAQSVNHLLVVGFYLMNFGFVCYNLRVATVVTNEIQIFEMLSSKMGIVTVVLGCMHFFNIWLFHRLRKNALMERESRPPALPLYFKNPNTAFPPQA